ncbi:hypothetical protein KY290_033445 [Solanum tuberosum]|uniref:MADS-box domain-containing protein n=1 Tax=Solanum tuberosum TaxID=4113 RepID=A0ABQ7U277_SOLTU|nr:hypothetical protein KY289_032800 [Solanum tuberosum]KAH0647445.1 hypothetical protein KY285_032693 [Solanum tuberosum]KAH0740402.1 hypothetical protein KY290_033445 [Solanum tuberosum]
MPRKSIGRKRIDIMKILNERLLKVTLPKRRTNLLKKANELCTMYGAETTIESFTPDNNAYPFGHPSEDRVGDTNASRFQGLGLDARGAMNLVFNDS